MKWNLKILVSVCVLLLGASQSRTGQSYQWAYVNPGDPSQGCSTIHYPLPWRERRFRSPKCRPKRPRPYAGLLDKRQPVLCQAHFRYADQRQPDQRQPDGS